MSTFNKIYKKVANNGNEKDYQVVGQVGVNGVPLDIMKGANSSSAGEIGLVPKPSAGASNRYLRSDGTWSVPPDTNNTYSVFTGSNNGLVPATDKGTYFLTGNGSWGYPWIGSWAEDGKTLICLGSGDDHLSTNKLPEATESANGLMSATDKSKINKIHFYEAWATSSLKAWTSQNDQSLSNFWPFVDGFGNSIDNDKFIDKVNSSTVKILKTGYYTFNIRIIYNTYGNKRMYLGYKINNSDLQCAVRLCTKSNWEEVFIYTFTDFLSVNDQVSFWLGAFDTGSSMYLTPLESHIYFYPWVA